MKNLERKWVGGNELTAEKTLDELDQLAQLVVQREYCHCIIPVVSLTVGFVLIG